MRYYATNVATNEVLQAFTSRGALTKWIGEQIQQRGLDWRAGYTIQFRDRVRIEVRNDKGKVIK